MSKNLVMKNTGYIPEDILLEVEEIKSNLLAQKSRNLCEKKYLEKSFFLMAKLINPFGNLAYQKILNFLCYGIFNYYPLIVLFILTENKRISI